MIKDDAEAEINAWVLAHEQDDGGGYNEEAMGEEGPAEDAEEDNEYVDPVAFDDQWEEPQSPEDTGYDPNIVSEEQIKWMAEFKVVGKDEGTEK
jgi:hypothetical protein